MKKLLSKYGPWLLTLAFGVVVFLFWRFRYPFALTYQEQLQFFLFDGDYFCSRMAEPGGFARYVAEFLVQFYNGVVIGAAILAVLFMLMQRFTWRLMRAGNYYVLSFLPAILLWYAMGDENVLLTYMVALLLAMAALLGWRRLGEGYRLVKWAALVVMIPLLYWLIGPLVLMVAVCLLPLPMVAVALVCAIACVLASSWVLPYPLLRLLMGLGYYRSPEVLPYVLMAVPALIVVMAMFCKHLPEPGKWIRYALALVVAGLLLLAQTLGFDARKYDLMEYDYLVRVRDWKGIVAKAEQKKPDLPMSVSATNLALAMTNQLGERAFEFYQRGSEGLLPPFERNFATAQLTGEIYFHLGLVNTAQRFAFESMESLPNYNKSARAVKRLAETNLVNGQYRVARKYLQLLEKTIFYRPWARRTMAMLGKEEAINAHPLYGTLRRYRLQEDFLFSEQEVDKVCGQLFMHNHQNQMAAQYLLMMPLLDRDVPRFMSYVKVVQNRIQYNPRAVQEGIAFAFMQQQQLPPQGIVSQWVQQQLNDFSRVYSQNRNSSELERFKNTVWYYLTVGK